MFEALIEELGGVAPLMRTGRLVAADTGAISVRGLEVAARLGDRIAVAAGHGWAEGEIVALSESGARAMTYAPTEGLALGAEVRLLPERPVRPGPGWAGHVIDAFGRPVAGGTLPPGPTP
ncbi:MAG: flagellum-specific ATP synthase FliI, partial [Alphaproteobacteria bacterium]